MWLSGTNNRFANLLQLGEAPPMKAPDDWIAEGQVPPTPPFIVPHFSNKNHQKTSNDLRLRLSFQFHPAKKRIYYVIIYNSKGEEKRNDLKAGLKRTFHPTQIGRLVPQFLSKGLHDAQTARLIAIQEFKESVGFAHLDISAASGGFGLKEFLICSTWKNIGKPKLSYIPQVLGWV